MNQSSIFQPKRQLRLTAVSCSCFSKNVEAAISSLKMFVLKTGQFKQSIRWKFLREKSLVWTNKIQRKSPRLENPTIIVGRIKVRVNVEISSRSRVSHLSRLKVVQRSQSPRRNISRVIEISIAAET